MLLAPGLRAQSPSAELIYFTQDGTATGAPLIPGFFRHSCWSALGTSLEGHVYIAISNHQQPGGNSAIYKYDTMLGRMSALGDLRSISTAAGNWMPNESQYKVHSFLMRDGSGKIWFASDDHPPTPFLRGAHLYQLDTATDVVTDYSRTQPMLLNQAMQPVVNTGQAAVGSGVFVEYYGIKGLYLNARAPDALYAITYPDGHVIEHDPTTGAIAKIGQAKHGAFLTYADNRGNFYYETSSGNGLAIQKYDRATGTTRTVATVPGFEVGAVAPTSCGEVVYWLIADTKKIYRHDCLTDQFVEIATACGSNWWRIYNLSLSPNGEALYYVSNNNAHSVIQRIDLVTGACTVALDVDALLGTRDLCFGGVNVWDRNGFLYAPVWTFSAPQSEDVALLKVGPFDRALGGAPGTLSTSAGGRQDLSLRAGPDHAGKTYWLLGSASGTDNGLRFNDLLIPLDPNDIYFDFAVQHPNQLPLTNSMGTLDALGRAQASFTLPRGVGALRGLTVHHAFAVLGATGEVVFTSNPEPVVLGQ